MNNEDLALDQVYVGRERVWVSTFMIYPDHYMTTVFGPGARAEDTETTRRSYASEEAALAGHEAMLASYGYQKTGLRQWKIFRGLENIGKGMVNVSRRPTSRKTAWVLTTTWAMAIIAPLVSIIFFNGLDFSRWVGWSNLVVGTFDGFMLYQSVRGLYWVYKRRTGILAG